MHIIFAKDFGVRIPGESLHFLCRKGKREMSKTTLESSVDVVNMLKRAISICQVTMERCVLTEDAMTFNEMKQTRPHATGRKCDHSISRARTSGFSLECVCLLRLNMPYGTPVIVVCQFACFCFVSDRP